MIRFASFYILLSLLAVTTSFAQVGRWQQMTLPGQTPYLHDIDMLDNDFGIAVGKSDINAAMGKDYSGILLTLDGGVNWIPIPGDVPVFNPALPDYTVWRSVSIVDERTAFIAGDSAMVYRTDDGGWTWREQTIIYDTLRFASRPTIHDIYFINARIGIAVGGDNLSQLPIEPHFVQIYATDNGGKNWLDKSPSPGSINNNYGALRAVHYSSGTWYAAGEFGLVLKNSGSGWQDIQIKPRPTRDHFIFTDIMGTSSIDFVVCGWEWTGTRALAYRTFNNATRFLSIVPNNLPPSIKATNALHFFDNSVGWLGASQKYIGGTTNGGSNWVPFNLGAFSPSSAMSAMDFTDPLNGWAVGGDETNNDSWLIRYYGIPPKSDISLSDAVASFADITCEPWVETEVWIRNSGTGELVINHGNIQFSSSEYELVGNPFPIKLLPKQSTSVTVRWSPPRTYSGTAIGTMTIYSNDPDHNPWRVKLEGTRYHGTINLDAVIPMSYGTCLGDSIYLTVPFFTAGNRPPTYIGFEFVSGNDDFELVTPDPGTEFDGFGAFSFLFVPADSGARSGTYRLINGNPACPDTSFVEMTGIGHTTIVTPLAHVIDFGDVCINTSRDTTITLTNDGNNYAVIGPLEYIDGDRVFESPDFFLYLKPDSVAPYNLRFTPTSKGDYEGRYRIVSGTCPDTTEFVFKGKGISTELETTPKSPITIGPIFVNRVASQTITIGNSGDTPARLTSIEMTTKYPQLRFTSKPALPKTLLPGQITSITLRFAPGKVGEYKTVVKVEWDNRCADSLLLDINAICVPNPEIDAPRTVDVGTQECVAPIIDTSYIRNKGNGPLVFYSISITGPDHDHFTVLSPAINDTAAPGSNFPLIVEFNRPTEGKSSAIVRLTHNDFDAGVTNIDYKGERTVSEFMIEGDSATKFFTRLFISETRTFTARNSGQHPVTITSLSVIKEDIVFAVQPSAPLPHVLRPGEGLPFDVIFTPNARGPFHGTVEIISDPCAYTVLLNLTGSGDTDGLSTNRGNIDFVLDPCTFTTSCEKIVLRNQAPESVDVLSLDITQSGTTFSIDPPVATPFTLGPNAEREFYVCADPALLGKDQGTLLISSNDPAYPTLPVALRSSRDSSGITVSATALDFGRLPDCIDPSPQRVTVTNTGMLDETIEPSFQDGTAFSTTFTAPENLRPGDTYSFDIVFTRPTYGVFNDVFEIRTLLCRNTYKIALTGEAVQQEYAVMPDPLNYPTVNVGGASTRQLTLLNNGGFDATVSSIVILPSTHFTVQPGYPTVVDAGGSINIDIRFSPTSEGDHSATACVIVAAPCADTICVTLNGRSVQGTLEVQPPVLTFDALAQCKTQTLSDTLTNSGSGPITILSAAISGTNAAAFNNLTPVTSPEIIVSAAQRIFDIRYIPALAGGDGPVNAVLTVQTDDPVLPVIDIPLEAERVTMTVDAGGAIDFGLVEIGTPEVRTVTVVNNGSVRFCYSSVQQPAVIGLSPSVPFCLDPGEQVELTVTLSAQQAGSWSDRLVLFADDPCTDSTVYTLTADVQEGSITQTPSVDLGTDVYCIERGFDIIIQNNYLEDATLESLDLQGPDAMYFSILSPTTLPQTVSAGGSLTVTMSFTAEQTDRSYDATLISGLRVFGSDIQRSTILDAVSVVPAVSVTSAAFPPTVIGQSGGTQELLVTNTSSLPLEISDIQSAEPSFPIRSIVPAPPLILQPGEVILVSVEFIPDDSRDYIDSLVVLSDGPCPFSANGELRGTGIPQPIVRTTLSIGAESGAPDDILRIPLTIADDIGNAEVTSWSGSIAFNRTMLHPVGVVTEGTISRNMNVNMSYDNPNGTVALTADGGTAAAGAGPLVYVECLVLIGNDTRSDISISEDFNFTTGYAIIESRTAGSFELTGYCLPDNRLLYDTGQLMLKQNRPNPVSLNQSSTTRVSYSTPGDGHVEFVMYNLMGRPVRSLVDTYQKAGAYEVVLPVSDLTPGVYYYMLRHNGEQLTRKILITR